MGMEDRLIEADAIVGGDRAAANERKLHDALRRHAAALPVPSFGASALFQSFFLGDLNARAMARVTTAASTSSRPRATIGMPKPITAI